MENKSYAVLEVLGYELNDELASIYYFNVYEFIFYNDGELFLKVVNYKVNFINVNQTTEEYHLFKFMLQLMLKNYPSKLRMLSPVLTRMTA